jgi:hypothetical protein
VWAASIQMATLRPVTGWNWKLMDVMWKRKRDGKLYVKDFGFVMRPLEVKSEKYKKEYEDLRTRLQGYLDAKDAEAGAKNGR